MLTIIRSAFTLGALIEVSAVTDKTHNAAIVLNIDVLRVSCFMIAPYFSFVFRELLRQQKGR